MEQRIVITGIGLVGPCGSNVDTFWENLIAGKANVEKLTASKLTNIRFAGKIKNLPVNELFSKRLLNKCDDFSRYALVASHEAIHQAGIESISPDRVGIFIGNNTGGWNSSYNGLVNLHSLHKPVSPYMASNWFPAAPQGHLSLAYGYTGISKTVISDRTSGILAIKHAIKNLKSGKIDVAVVGGVEAPVNEWAMHFYESTQEVSLSNAYEFGGTKSTGYLLSEGSAFLILENEQHAIKRNSPSMFATITNIQFQNYSRSDPNTRFEMYKNMLSSSQDNLNGQLIFPACVGNCETDAIEIKAINELKFINSYISFSKIIFGNTVAASSITDIILAVKSMEQNIVPWGTTMPAVSGSKREFNSALVPFKPVNNCIISSVGYGGSLAAISIKKFM